MKRLIVIFALLIAAFTLTAGAAVAAGGKLKCFLGSPASCAVDPSSDSATLDTEGGGYAGVYLTNGKSLNGSPLSSVVFTFEYDCATFSGPCVGGGSPRWSIPIDSTGDGKTDGYAFIDPNNCGQAGAESGTITTTDLACQVFYEAGAYPNWDAFSAAHPAYTIGNALPFVIADSPFHGVISEVTFSKS